MKNLIDCILENMSFDDKIEKWWDKYNLNIIIL